MLTVNTSTGACTCDALGETPVAGDIVAFADYYNATAEQKLWGYISKTTENFAPLSCCTDPDNDADDATGWSGDGFAFSVASAAGGDTGFCLEGTIAGANATKMYCELTGLTVGETYTIQVKVKSGTATNTQITFYIYDAGAFTNGATFSDAVISSASWQTVTGTFTASETAHRLSVNRTSGGNGTWLIDDVRVDDDPFTPHLILP